MQTWILCLTFLIFVFIVVYALMFTLLHNNSLFTFLMSIYFLSCDMTHSPITHSLCALNISLSLLILLRFMQNDLALGYFLVIFLYFSFSFFCLFFKRLIIGIAIRIFFFAFLIFFIWWWVLFLFLNTLSQLLNLFFLFELLIFYIDFLLFFWFFSFLVIFILLLFNFLIWTFLIFWLILFLVLIYHF